MNLALTLWRIAVYGAFFWSFVAMLMRGRGMLIVAAACVAAHALFYRGADWALDSHAVESIEYARIYAVFSMLPMCVALIAAACWCWKSDGFTGLVGLVVVAVACLTVGYVLGNAAIQAGLLTEAFSWRLLMADTFTAAGVSTLLSLGRQAGPAEDAVKLGLGALWVFTGVYLYAYQVGRLNPYCGWVTRAYWIPSLALVVAFGWMGWKLSSGQRELSRQPLPDVIEAEYGAAQVDGESSLGDQYAREVL